MKEWGKDGETGFQTQAKSGAEMGIELKHPEWSYVVGIKYFLHQVRCKGGEGVQIQFYCGLFGSWVDISNLAFGGKFKEKLDSLMATKYPSGLN